MSDPVDINALLHGAANDGLLGGEALGVLTGIDDLGARIQAGLGTPADLVQSAQVILVALMPDDSGSMEHVTDDVLNGHNGVIDALKQSKQADSILFYSKLLNGRLVNPYTPLDQATLLSRGNYRATGCTPLFDESLGLLGTVMAKSQEFSANGVPVRTISLIMTDGADNQSRHTARQVEPLVRDLLRAENHIVAAMGIAETPAQQQQFRGVFKEMGIEDKWILTPANTAHDLRAAFQMFSNSAVRASQGQVNFSNVAGGGFGN